MSGERGRDSITRKIAISTADAARTPIVWAEPHPTAVGLGEPVDQQHQARRDGDRAERVEVARDVVGLALAHEPRDQHEGARPIGTLTKKIHSQPAYSVRMPPSSTPIAAPAPAMAPRIPSALLRSDPSAKVTSVIENTDGERIAPAAPWSARAAISIAVETARTERGRGEAGEADHEQAPASEQVARAAAQEQEAAERQRVGR